MINYYSILNKETGYQIKIKAFVPEGDYSRVFISCHGFSASKDGRTVTIIANRLLEQNIATVAFDFPCHGQSEAEDKFLTVENSLLDLNYIIEHVKNNYKKKKICLLGRSYGGFIILNHLAAKPDNDYEKIVLCSPAVNMNKSIKDLLPAEKWKKFETEGYYDLFYEGRTTRVLYEFYNGLCKYNLMIPVNINNNILIVHGSKDEVVLIEDVYKFIKLNAKNNIKLIEMSDAGHDMTVGEKERVADYLFEYLK